MSAKKQRRLAPDDRKRLLLEATVACLAKYGPQGAGLRQVARELGVAPSLITYFFDGWQDLLSSAYRHLGQRFQDQFDAVFHETYASERERIDALFRWFLSEEWLDDDYAGAYVSLWALSRTEVDLRGMMTEFYVRQRDSLAEAIKGYAAERGGKVANPAAADALLIFLNGVWTEMILNPQTLSEESARDMAWLWLDGITGKIDGKS